jgi:hypothetical protein
MTGSMGRGVFATERIPAGTMLGEFHTLTVSLDRAEALVDHVFIGDDGAATLVFGWLSLVNHGPANIEKQWSWTDAGEIVRVRTSRDVARGEQLFFDYQFEPGTAPAWAAPTAQLVDAER